MNDEPTVNVALTSRELTLIRVACLQRLNRLKERRDDLASHPQTNNTTWAITHNAVSAAYDDTRSLMQDKLWTAVQTLKREGGQ